MLGICIIIDLLKLFYNIKTGIPIVRIRKRVIMEIRSMGGFLQML